MKRLLFIALLFVAIPAAAQSHSAQFTWTASTSTGVTSYNYYRAPCTGTVTSGVCSAAGAFVKLNTSPITGTSHTDTTVVAGQRYDSYITSLCPVLCNPPESLESNHQAFIVPLDGRPQPPTNFFLALLARIWHFIRSIFA